ncbi:hypothetical protein [Mucilaginibacter aquatilis]|uniref:Uncharacterized protein n=1 Tax=Mucilaginibacter aquatilis TaxID=1517760 RepID=A0A6I4IQQ8_9SPHI|nr:hypothetical protein [Mucilaginibacter aquatilis]MVN91564.1 hypothetical protein [Mucilaginibacter aquatilis]
MIEPSFTTIAARLLFVCEEEIIFSTSDLNAYKKHIHPHDIGQMSTGDQIYIGKKLYNIDSINIEHYSWPMEGHIINQLGTLYPYTINITVILTALFDKWQ